MNPSTNVRAYCHADIMLEYMAIGIALFDAQDLRLLEANKLFLTLFDTHQGPCRQPEEILGHPLTDWLYNAQESGIVDIFRKVAETGIPYRGDEFAFPSRKRGVTYWNWTLDPVRDQDGHIIYIVHTVSDVTAQVLARQQAEQAQSALSLTNSIVEAERKRLEVTETVARSVRESLDPEHIGNVAIDAIRTHFNSTSACLHIADPAQRALRLLCAYTPPGREDAMRAMQYIPYEQMLATKQAVQQHDPITVEDLQAAAAAGLFNKHSTLVHMGTRGYICVPLWFGDYFEGTLCATFATTVQPDGPEVSALVSCGTHIAAALAHARLHATMKSERTRLRDILDQLPEGILIAEVSNGTISYANPAAASILGIPLKDLVEIPLHQHPWSRIYREAGLSGQQIPPWNFIVIRALSGETITSKETMVIRPGGGKAITLASSAPLYSESGIMTGAVIVFQDVTAQKSLEQHKNEFLSIANHELRTPITIIQGFAEILQLQAEQGHSLNSLSQYALTSITEQSQHLTHLIEEMLDISRIEQAQFTLQPAPHNLLALLTHAIENQAITTRQHDIHLVLDVFQSPDVLMGNVDEKRIMQVFNNLISNAIKYSPSGGEIEIGVRHTPDKPNEAMIWVKDHGIGIAANEIPHIFKRFHRASSLDHSLSGFGIGLYLVKEVVTHHGGRVWVESTEGQGTTFYIVLPLNSPTHT